MADPCAPVMLGATSSVDGLTGLVPKPLAGDNLKFLRGDATWQYPNPGGPIISTGLTMATAHVLGRSSASTGAIEEISLGAGLLLASGTLSVDSSVITTTGTQTLTNKTINGTNNFITNVSLATGVIGNLPVGNLNGGLAASGTTFWAGDGTWKTAGTGTVTSVSLTVPSGLSVTGSPVTTTGTLAITTALNGIIKGNGTGFLAATAGTDYEIPLTFSTGLTRATNTVTVNAIQNITRLSNLTTNGFVKTTGANGTLSVDTSTYITGNQTITLGTDLSGSGATTLNATIVAGAVTLAKMANLAANSIIGNNTGSPATPLALTGTQVTAMLTAMVGDSGSGGTKGLVPAPASGDAAALKFLKADGTWAVPAGGGGGTPAGSNTQIQYNNGGAFGASAGLTWNDTTKLFALTGSIGSGGSVRTSITNSNSGGYADHFLFNNLGNYVGFQMAGSAVGVGGYALLSSSATSYFNISTTAAPITFSVSGSTGDIGRWSAAANWLVGVTADTGITGAGGIRTKNSVLVGDGSVAGTTVTINSSTFTLLQYSRGSVTKFSTGTANAANDYITGSVQDDMNFKSDASKSINFSVDNGSSMGLRLITGSRLLVAGATDDTVNKLQVNGGMSIIGVGSIAPTTDIAESLNVKRTTASTTGTLGVVSFEVDSTGTPTNGFGGGNVFYAKSSTTAKQAQAAIETLWTDVTHATRTAALRIGTVINATYAERMRISGAGNLLIGTTTDNVTDKLQVNGSILGTSHVLSGGGAMTGSSGAVALTASGTNQNITLNPSGTGEVRVTGGSNTVLNILNTTSSARLRLTRNSTSNGSFLEFLTTGNADEFYMGMPNSAVIAGGNTWGIIYYNGSSDQLYFTLDTAGVIKMAGTTDASSSSTGQLVTSGGVGIAKKLYVGSTTAASSTTTGSAVFGGGLGVAGDIYLGTGTYYSGGGNVTGGGVGDVYVSAAGTNKDVTLRASGTGAVRVGINTSAPGMVSGTQGLYLVQPNSTNNFLQIDAWTAEAGLTFRPVYGTAASPTANIADGVLGLIEGKGYANSAYTTARASIWFRSSEAWTSSAQGSYIRFNTTLGGTITQIESARISAAGNLLIGTTADTGLTGAGGISVTGGVVLAKTNITTGTTGAQTINKTSGSVNFAAAATSLVVTNSLVTTASTILLTVATNDATMHSAKAVAAAGSFTIFANAAPTAETRVSFAVFN